MNAEADDLEGFLAQGPDTRWAGASRHYVPSTGSTNDLAHTAAAAGAPHGHLVLADQQTAGRGRLGRVWQSSPGCSLLASFVVRPRALPVSRGPLLALATGLAVREAVERVTTEARATLKWPNDVRLAGHKVAGILVEASLRGTGWDHAVVGIGINVRAGAIPPDAPFAATWLDAHTASPVRRADLARALCAAFEWAFEAADVEDGGDTVRAFTAACDTLGARVRTGDETGVARAIAPSGALVLARDDGSLVEVYAGDVLPSA